MFTINRISIHLCFFYILAAESSEMTNGQYNRKSELKLATVSVKEIAETDRFEDLFRRGIKLIMLKRIFLPIRQSQSGM